MLRVTIDLVPQGDEGRTRTLRTIEIVNTGVVMTGSEYLATMTAHDDATSYHVSFVHRRSDGVEACVRRALEALER